MPIHMSSFNLEDQWSILPNTANDSIWSYWYRYLQKLLLKSLYSRLLGRPVVSSLAFCFKSVGRCKRFKLKHLYYIKVLNRFLVVGIFFRHLLCYPLDYRLILSSNIFDNKNISRTLDSSRYKHLNINYISLS